MSVLDILIIPDKRLKYKSTNVEAFDEDLKSIVKNRVFMRFHFFEFFAILMTSGTSWDLILDIFGGLETSF